MLIRDDLDESVPHFGVNPYDEKILVVISDQARCNPRLNRVGAMSYLVEFAADEGSTGTLVFEVDESEISSDLVLASPDPGKIADRARVTLEEALNKIKPPLHKFVDAFKELSPQETEIEFGIKMGGETGMVVAKGTAEVNFVIRMTWKSE